MATKEEILNALGDVVDPELGRSITDLDMVREVRVDGGRVAVDVALTVAGCPLQNRIEQEVRQRVGALPGVEQVEVHLSVMEEEERQRLSQRLRGQEPGRTSTVTRPGSRTVVIGVASGKGGVGKSTVTANLAIALRKRGKRVGLLDADIYGFSIPRMLGVTTRPVAIGNAIAPVEAYGLQVMSMGFFVEEDAAVIWRGPMLAGALEQFLNDVLWAELDYLVVDLPPGTGDVPMSLAQRLPHSKILLVTTPQEASVHVASRAAFMAMKMNQEMLGVVENMAFLVCPHCGEQIDVFGAGGADALAAALGVPVVARIPLAADIREGGDQGRPVAAREGDSPLGKAFDELAETVVARTGDARPARRQIVGPRIGF
ncbi:MAG: Mrp/NBP35 family ATP-binding protein [Bacillota bacterium]|nr:Mrp/NBP35 family ATP-binding protein [Bacillota bacterium]